MIRTFLSCFLPILILFMGSCKKEPAVRLPIPTKGDATSHVRQLDKAQYYDKVLGALVGSAIGDAMGASTEMWHRNDIQKEFGYIKGLTPVSRTRSAEGIWSHHLDSGATTDDTRWKFFMTKYFTQHKDELSADNFTDFVATYYQTEVRKLSNDDVLHNPDLLDESLQKVDWIKEWARVALAYKEGRSQFSTAQNRFYGGEMSCAGMLYSPMIGLISSSPEQAYIMAFEHSIFDIGYAKDITSIVSAMTYWALKANSMDEIHKKSLLIDPYNYLNSRLIERQASSIAKDSELIVISSFDLPLTDTLHVSPPTGFEGSKYEWMRQKFVYDELEKRQKAIAFHAGEIWQILNAALVFGEGDFRKTMEFIVNYGRDNDTVAAIAGMILGAKDGYERLPLETKNRVLKVSKEHMGIDLEQLANELTDIY
jgi:hypothetical protein